MEARTAALGPQEAAQVGQYCDLSPIRFEIVFDNETEAKEVKELLEKLLQGDRE